MRSLPLRIDYPMASLPSPAPCVLEHYASQDLEPALRRDAWREIAHRWVDFRPAPEVPLEAEMTILASDACIMGATRSSAYEMGTGPHWAHPEDMVVLTLMQSGEMVPSEHPRKGPGALSLCAPREVGRFRWSQGARQVFLALPRHDVYAALGREPQTQLLNGRGALTPALISQMNHMASLMRQPGQVDGVEFAGLLDATRALALLALRNLGRNGERVDLPGMEESLNRGRHAAALRFMAREAHRHELDSKAIAGGVGCSRSRLYEAFAARGQTVMGALRELRLQRARSLIEESPRLHLGSVSWRSGFADQSGFSKLFKARFGMVPSQWHQQAWSNPDAGQAATMAVA
jgi:AraC-like DNA-binding protein